MKKSRSIACISKNVMTIVLLRVRQIVQVQCLMTKKVWKIKENVKVKRIQTVKVLMLVQKETGRKIQKAVM